MRSEITSQWLATTEWSSWARSPVTGDASARRYERISNNAGRTVILMDAPPQTCGSQSQFVNIARHLTALGLSAPDILEWDEGLGLMILSDLGQTDFAKHSQSHPKDELDLYAAAVDVLSVVQSATPPAQLVTMTPDRGVDMLDLAFEWAATDQSADLAETIKAELRHLLTDLEPTSTVLSLRDFHAENLIWRPDQTGLARVGLLDFQDAFVTHPTYDLASLVRDARRDVSPEILPVLLRQLAGQGRDLTHFQQAFHVMAVQRNLRILGIFQRLAQQDGKAHYLSFVPRVWAHLQSDLAADGLRELTSLVMQAFEPKDALA